MIRIKLYNFIGDMDPKQSLINPEAVTFIRPGGGGNWSDPEGVEHQMSDVCIAGMVFYVEPDDCQDLIDAVEGYTKENPRGSKQNPEPELLQQTLIAESADTHRSLETVDKALDTMAVIMTSGKTVNR